MQASIHSLGAHRILLVIILLELARWEWHDNCLGLLHSTVACRRGRPGPTSGSNIIMSHIFTNIQGRPDTRRTRTTRMPHRLKHTPGTVRACKFCHQEFIVSPNRQKTGDFCSPHCGIHWGLSRSPKWATRRATIIAEPTSPKGGPVSTDFPEISAPEVCRS